MNALEELQVLLKPAGGGLYLVSTGKAEQQALQRRFYDAATDADISQKYRASLASIANARVVLLGIPSDVGAGFRRGANLGPQSIRLRLLEDDPRFPQWCKENGVVDAGDVFVVPQLLSDDLLAPVAIERCQRALYPDVPAADRAWLPVSPLSIAERAIARILEINPGAKIVMLGGDHSCAWPVVKAMHGAGKRFCIVQIDAHTDLMEERLGIPICFATWTFHANELIGRNKRTIQLGIRATRFPKEHWESKTDVVQVWATDAASDQDAAIERVVRAAKATGLPVYFSNDIDGTDAVDADATGTPEPDGLPVDTVRRLIARLGAEVGLVGGDVVEVAPVLGRDGGKRTLEVAALYLRDTLAQLLK